jgi:hypothetical protein
MLKHYLAKVMQRVDLDQAEAEAAMELIMTVQATPAQIGGYLVALRMKGETVEEITGSPRAMRKQATRVTGLQDTHQLFDTAGTGGDGAHTFNISTAAAFVLAGTGRKVAKHGRCTVPPGIDPDQDGQENLAEFPAGKLSAYTEGSFSPPGLLRRPVGSRIRSQRSHLPSSPSAGAGRSPSNGCGPCRGYRRCAP